MVTKAHLYQKRDEAFNKLCYDIRNAKKDLPLKQKLVFSSILSDLVGWYVADMYTKKEELEQYEFILKGDE